MKKHLTSFFTAAILCLFWSPLLHGQDYTTFKSAYIEEDTNEEETIEPVYQYEHIPDFTYDEVAKKVREIDSDMSFELNETIFAFINYFVVRNRDYTRMILERRDVYFPMFEETLAKHDMPEDIKYLAIIESGLNPRARSRVGAMGLWQFMPATGNMYSLNYGKDIDDRMDPELSTEAAAKYLKALYRMFNDWEVALAAYNCGPGNVRKAIRRSGGKRTFWGIYNFLPRETRSYVPQFQAMMYVLRYAEDHNLVLENPVYPIAYEKVLFNQELDLEKLAQIADLCIEDIEELNPSIQNRLIPSSHKNIALRIPKSKVAYITENKTDFADAVKLTNERSIALRTVPGNNVSKPTTAAATTKVSNRNEERFAYKVKSGDFLGKIAQQHGTSVDKIKEWNNLNSNNIKVGQTLFIFANNSSSSNSLSENSSEGSRVYTVQPGDSLWLISKKLDGVSIEKIKELNNLNSNQIKPGQKLIIG
jgi:membrane-bound lytic murein transglycosylase D